MAHPTLLNADDPWFSFQHAMNHRDFLGVMSPLTRFSGIPYFIDPFTARRPADNWHFNHQTAHDDADNAIPSTYMAPPAVVGFSPNMKDANLANAWDKSWFIFLNHMEHFVESQAILPAPQIPPPPPAPIIKYPFW
jgi:hypothetical protein